MVSRKPQSLPKPSRLFQSDASPWPEVKDRNSGPASVRASSEKVASERHRTAKDFRMEGTTVLFTNLCSGVTV